MFTKQPTNRQPQQKFEHFWSLINRGLWQLYINRRFAVATIIVFQKQFIETMAYYFYINPGVSSFTPADPWQGYYSSIPSLYQSNDEFLNPSIYTVTWPQTEFLSQNEQSIVLLNTQIPEEGQHAVQSRVVSAQKPKKASKTLEKQILSAKKNSESNIINQFYSFFGSREKSEKIVERCCKLMGKRPEHLEKIFSLFYFSIRLINSKRGRKYVNVAMFLKFFNPDQLANYLPEMVERLAGCEELDMEELCQIFRRCCKHFLKNVSASAILTSKRISIVSKEEHLKKRRKFLRTITQI